MSQRMVGRSVQRDLKTETGLARVLVKGGQETERSQESAGLTRNSVGPEDEVATGRAEDFVVPRPSESSVPSHRHWPL